jgi:hypothetical protein
MLAVIGATPVRRINPRKLAMRVVGISLAAAGLSSLFLSAVLVYAALTPVGSHAKPETRMAGWLATVTVTRKQLPSNVQ